MDSYNNPYAAQNSDRNVFDSNRGRDMNGAMMVQGVPHVPHLPNTNIKTHRVNNIDSLLEKEKNMRFQLRGQKDDFTYQPESKRFTFYQFCRMYNPGRTARNRGKKVHEMRKLVYDEDYQLVSKKEAIISKAKLQKFIDNAPDHKYTLYETYEIESVDLPSDLERRR
jgi:hypothetical protein